MSEIYPVFDKMVGRSEKESLLGQKGVVVWFTGLSGSGKSTIALAVEKELHQRGVFSVLLDGDNIRTGICNNLGFSMEDRNENIRRIAEVAKLFCQNGIVTLCSFVSPTQEIRSMAREIIGSDFLEIFVDTPIEVCEQRDVKGLYKKARAGLIKDFSGIDSPFEKPESPNLTLNTQNVTVEQSVNRVLELIEQ